MPDADALSRQKAKVTRGRPRSGPTLHEVVRSASASSSSIYSLAEAAAAYKARALLPWIGISSSYLSFPQATCVCSRSRRVPMRSQEPCKLRLPNHPRAVISTEAQRSGETPAFEPVYCPSFFVIPKGNLRSPFTTYWCVYSQSPKVAVADIRKARRV